MSVNPLPHYFDVFCPETASIIARCKTQSEAEKSARLYHEGDGRDYVVYECSIVFRTAAPPSEE